MDQQLPAQIQAQLDEANAIEKAIADEQAALTAPPENTVVETKPEPIVPAAELEPPTKAPPAEEETWQKRFSVLQGKFNAEVPRLAAQLKELTQVNESLHKQVEALAVKQTEQTVAQTVTSEDEEAFGAELIAVMKKVAKQEAAALEKIQKAEVQRVNNKIETVEKTQAATAGDKFMDAIAKAVPDWETVNADPKWLEWLDEYSPETGAPRQVALDTASNTLDSARAVALFNAYKSTQTEKTPVENTTTTTSAQKAQEELKRQVAPAKTVAKAPIVNAEQTWTGKEYEQAFDVRNERTMTKTEITDLQNAADLAYNEGRVRW